MGHGCSERAVRQAELQLLHLTNCVRTNVTASVLKSKYATRVRFFVLMICVLTGHNQPTVLGGRIQNKVVHMMHSLASRQKKIYSRSHFQRETYRLQADNSNAESLPDLVRDSCLYQVTFKKSHRKTHQYYPRLNKLRKVKKKNKAKTKTKVLLIITPTVTTNTLNSTSHGEEPFSIYWHLPNNITMPSYSPAS